jgi:hypothetical protein
LPNPVKSLLRRTAIAGGLATLAVPGIAADHLPWWTGLLLGLLAAVIAALVVG